MHLSFKKVLVLSLSLSVPVSIATVFILRDLIDQPISMVMISIILGLTLTLQIKYLVESKFQDDRNKSKEKISIHTSLFHLTSFSFLFILVQLFL